MDIRPLSVGDLDGLATLIDDMFIEMADAAYYPSYLIDQYREAYRLTSLAEKLSADTMLILGEFESGRLVAFLIAKRDAKQSLYLEWVFVSPRHRRMGIGARLIHEAIRWATDRLLHSVWFYVVEKNTPARQFYAKLGFVPREARIIAGWRFLEFSRSIVPVGQPRADAA